jgi:hypothetical protein
VDELEDLCVGLEAFVLLFDGDCLGLDSKVENGESAARTVVEEVFTHYTSISEVFDWSSMLFFLLQNVFYYTFIDVLLH